MTATASRTAPFDTTRASLEARETRSDVMAGPSAQEKEVASYLADMILELRNTAKSSKLHRVMVPLEFAYYEAFNIAHHVDVPKAEAERLAHLTEVAKAYEDGATAVENKRHIVAAE
jgi:hypothetical protein